MQEIVPRKKKLNMSLKKPATTFRLLTHLGMLNVASCFKLCGATSFMVFSVTCVIVLLTLFEKYARLH